MTVDATQGALFTHRNHYLFADYYLDRRTRDRQEWREADAGSTFAAVTALWRRFKPQGDNEAQTEADWIRPVLEALGHRYNVQVGMQTPLGVKVPDYVFYPDEATRQAAKRGVLTEVDFQGALAVGDAKAWDRPLDRAAPKAVSTLHENPSLQIDTYIRHSGVAWGILTNGRLWRLYHKDTSKKLDVYYEVDLPALIEQGDVEAFKYFWLFFRREAFVAGAHATAAPAWLDLVLAESQAYEQGVSENLKTQVYDALRHLGQGFLDLPSNGLRPTPETLAEIHDNSLIVLYRLLYMLYAEARDLLPVHENRLYAEGYSLEAFKSRIAGDLDDGRPAATSMSGLWQRLLDLWHVIDTGDATLGIPAYNGGLFRPDKHPFLERYRVGDLHLRLAIDLLARALDPVAGCREFVDYRDLEIRHLGSIYEGLLEYQLRCAAEPLVIVRQKGKERYEPANGAVPDVPAGQVYLVTDKGERKATGSYYTPDYIVQYIVEQTVGPVLAERTARFRQPDGRITDEAGLAQAILEINCLDPAMGSGHFLVAAAEYIARYVVGLGLAPAPERTGESNSPSEIERPPQGPTVSAFGRFSASGGDFQSPISSAEPELAYWRRRVAQACIYGVDRNPLAVELAKLSLWLATVSKDKPLSFLDHHLRCGNSLIGARVADLPLGLAPVEQVAKERKAAYKAQEAARKKEEAARAAGQITMLDDSAFAGAMHTASGMMRLIEDLGSETLADVHRAEEVYRDSVRAVTERARLLGDVWTARHFGLALDETLWGGLSRYLLHGGFEMPAYRPVIEHAQRIAGERRFFHWELEFPEVFFDEHGRLVEGGGFDVVMGNPPYGDILDHDSKAYLAAVTQMPTAGRSDVYADFIVRCVCLLAEERILGFIIPNTLIDGGSFGEFRRNLTQVATPIRIRDFKTRHVFDAAEVLTMVICLSKSSAMERGLIVYEHWDDVRADFKVDDMRILSGSIDPWHITNIVMNHIESSGLCLPLEPGIGTCHDAGVDYKWKDVGWQHRGEQPRFAKLLFYSGEREHPDDYALVKGESVNRYYLDAGANWLIHDYQKYRTPQTTVLVYLALALVDLKVLTRQTSDRIQAAIDSTRLVPAKSIHTTIVRAEGYVEEFLLALLNSRLMTYIYRLRTGEIGRTFAQVKLYDLRQLPVRRIPGPDSADCPAIT